MVQSAHHPERLDFLALRVHARACEGFALDNPYSDLHGGFGLMLHAHLRPVYEDLFAAQGDSAEVRAYVLRPGPALCRALCAGEAFWFDLTLVGPALRHAASALEALALLGVNGVTRARHRYEVARIEALRPEGEALLWSPESGWCVHALAPVAAADIVEEGACEGPLRLIFDAPLRLKHGGEVLTACPPPQVFAARLLARLQLLATQQTGEPLFGRAEKTALLEQAARIRAGEHALSWTALERYSARQRQRMETGGLAGFVQFENVAPELAGWFALGCWLHLGAKTSFGLGHYALSGRGAAIH